MRKKINMVPVPKLKKLIQGTSTEINQLKKAFTLVELIVVITILAILATVGFVSFSGYLAGTRDVNRISQLKSMSDALELYRTKKDLPIPDDKVDIKASGSTIAYQGYIGKNVLETIEYTESGLDPKDKNYFSYYLTKNKKYFQLLSFLEEPNEDVVAINNKRPVLGTKNIALKTGLRKVDATDYSSRYPKTTGKKLGILTDENNTPIQEIETVKSSGSLDIVTTNDNYIANISDSTQITGTGSKLLVLDNLVKSGGKIFNSCKAILDDNSSYKGKDGFYLINPKNNLFKAYCYMTTDGGGWTRVLSEDYESPVSGWSGTNTITTCGSFGNILGGYNIISTIDNSKTIDLLKIPHSNVRVKLDYIKIDSWDNEEAFVKLDGTKLFSENYLNSDGNQICGSSNGLWNELKVPINVSIGNISNILNLDIGSGLNQSSNDESYGIDNLEVYVK